MRKCTVFIEKSEYGYSAYIGDTPLEFGCIGEGKTVEETIEDFLGTFEAMKQDYISAATNHRCATAVLSTIPPISPS